MFEQLVPMAVHQALTSYEHRKNQLVTDEVAKLRDATQLLNRYSHLNKLSKHSINISMRVYRFAWKYFRVPRTRMQLFNIGLSWPTQQFWYIYNASTVKPVLMFVHKFHEGKKIFFFNRFTSLVKIVTVYRLYMVNHLKKNFYKRSFWFMMPEVLAIF